MKLSSTVTVTAGINHQRSVRRVRTPMLALVGIGAAEGVSRELLTEWPFQVSKYTR